jgi:hypothetical protein
MKYCEICKAECLSYTPQFGNILNFPNQIVFVGEIDTILMLKNWKRKKIIRFWIGSDVLLLRMFPPGRGKLSVLKHRLKVWLTEPFIDEHWVYGNQLFKEFKEVWSDRKAQLRLCRASIDPVVRVPSETVNVAYYHPRDDIFARWVYGIDFIERLMLLYPQVNWIKLDGTLNPKYFFQALTGHIRPSRSDGHPRLIEECKVHGIPFYWSENCLPDLEEMSKFVESLL